MKTLATVPSGVTSALKSCVAVAEELLSQREFFEFHREEIPQHQRDISQPRYTGSRSNDEETNLRVGAMRLLGFSDRAIERECGIDRRTIPHRLDWCVQTNRIPAQKDRLLRHVGESAEKSGLILAALLDRAAAGECSTDLAAMIKAVATSLGITVEKVQLLTGSPTEILETRAGAGREEIERWWREQAVPVQATVTPASDSASAGEQREPQQMRVAEAAGHAADTSATPDTRTSGPPAPVNGLGRGGSPKMAGGENGDGSTAL